MSDLNIPGVTDRYGTKDLISGLMEVERVPLEREEARLEGFNNEQSAWREVNSQMTTLRDSSRNLFSFENPFSLKLASSTQEHAITANPSRDANFESFKVEVLQKASADRFLSGEIDSDFKVPAGEYAFRVSDKTIKLNWRGGKLDDFVSAINRRSADTVKASLIGVTRDTKSLLIESLVTGSENKLIFEGAAEQFAKDIGMIQIKPETSEITMPLNTSTIRGTGNLSSQTIQISDTALSLPPQSGFETNIPTAVKSDSANIIRFTASASALPIEEPTQTDPTLPYSGIVSFKDVTLSNENVDITLPEVPQQEFSTPVEDFSSVFIRTSSGQEIPLKNINMDGSSTEYSITVGEYPDISSIIVRNNNTHKTISLSPFEVLSPSSTTDFAPTNAIEQAGDAILKYQGITITRPTNEIDDIVPNVTLNVHDTTDKEATITISPDTETAKEQLITFVAQYNRLIAEVNILTQNNPEVITELAYLSDDEVETANERLGMFTGEFALTNTRSSLQQIMSNSYPTTDNSDISMLSQIGISTSASTGGFSGVASSRLRGYLEINEDVLDEALENNILDIKNLFGYDSDEDLVIDTGLAYEMEKHLHAFTQVGGIIATKNSTLDRQIDASQDKIETLEDKLVDTEQRLRVQYGRMESTLNSLESQSSSISNFSNQNSSGQ